MVRFKEFEIIASSVDGTLLTFDIRKGILIKDKIDSGIVSFAVSND